MRQVHYHPVTLHDIRSGERASKLNLHSKGLASFHQSRFPVPIMHRVRSVSALIHRLPNASNGNRCSIPNVVSRSSLSPVFSTMSATEVIVSPAHDSLYENQFRFSWYLERYGKMVKAVEGSKSHRRLRATQRKQ